MRASFMVVSPNRVGRNVRAVAEFIDLALEHGVKLIRLREGIDLDTPLGRAPAVVAASLGRPEVELRSEAVRAGLAAAKEKAEREGREWSCGGSHKGRSLKATEEIAETIHFHHQRGLSYRKIGRIVHLSDKTVREVVLRPRQQYLSRREQAVLLRQGKRRKAK